MKIISRLHERVCFRSDVVVKKKPQMYQAATEAVAAARGAGRMSQAAADAALARAAAGREVASLQQQYRIYLM